MDDAESLEVGDIEESLDVSASSFQPSEGRKLSKITEDAQVDHLYGFDELSSETRVGWLFNMQMSEFVDPNTHRFQSALNLYFIANDSGRFKVTHPVRPYFYVIPRDEYRREIMTRLARKYAERLFKISFVDKEDLSLANHLVGLRRTCIRVSFHNLDDMNAARRELLAFAQKSRTTSNHRHQARTASFISGDTSTMMSSSDASASLTISEPLEHILDLREHDVSFITRAAIDLQLCTGRWYQIIKTQSQSIVIEPKPSIVHQPDPGILAFDIETTKSPLKFPDANIDQIIMISYMLDGSGFLLNNREIIGENVDDFEYTPKREFPGQFRVVNLPNEKTVLEHFLAHIARVRPLIFVTYNGDSFDWPFVETRANQYGISLRTETGFSKSTGQIQDYLCRPCVHMDCLKWVKRDSYLPIGSQGLKAVTRAKLRYDPVEVDPELMCKYAAEKPQLLCTYSVSDAVATYYLYTKYVHPFIFALCTIIPLGPDDVLRNGSSTLCEGLLMAEAYKANVIFPNRQISAGDRFTNDGHLIEQETYVGASVEALESGVFRSDIPIKFKMSPVAIQDLIQKIDRTLKLAVETEGFSVDEVNNLDKVAELVAEKLYVLKDAPFIKQKPVIYHLDVGAMYPNIILTNRLQPSAIVTNMDCVTCSFNTSAARCKRSMEWVSRAEYMPATRSEVQRVRAQLETERFCVSGGGGGSNERPFNSLPAQQKLSLEKKRLSEYCRKVYKKIHFVREEKKETVLCQRENSFYVDTVRAFRDRRYEFKALHKQWKRKLEKATSADEVRKCGDMVVLYDSLQMAHKCILNSFYGYVMRKGARWYSMEMAGIVCYTGSQIITKARSLVDQIGKPLELDTDGIWCMLPSSFPANFEITTHRSDQKSFKISYPCAMLNLLVKDNFTNDQYHELVIEDDDDDVEDGDNQPRMRRIQYTIKPENSILFEVDGPYHAMILPASKEEGKRIKKRYCVFNFDRTIAELKGFEVKRNGELELIKIFQSSVFDAFLDGCTLEQSYQSAAKVANYWLDILFAKGRGLSDDELFELIAENRRMSRQLNEYGSQKSTSISTAKRLAEFLGEQMIKDKGLTCRFIIARRPEGAAVADRAIPVAIFQAELAVRRHFLKKWLKIGDFTDFDIRNHIDWDYYIDRFNGCLQKLITIPASFQGISNPLPRVRYPDWLQKKLMEKFSLHKQQKMEDFFKVEKREPERVVVIEPEPRVEQIFVDTREVPKPQQISLGASARSFHEYLRFYKEIWRKLVQEPKRRKAKVQLKKSVATVAAALTSSDIRFFVKETRVQISLQILEIFALPAGMARIIAIDENGRPYCVNLRTNRIFYVNRSSPLPSEVDYCQLSDKILPRGAESKFLYEYNVPERFFLENSHDITTELVGGNDVCGIYELQITPIVRFVIDIGTMCRVDSSLIAATLNKDQIIKEDPVEASSEYLSDDTIPETLYMYFHKKKVRTKRHFREIALVVLVLTSQRKARVLVLDHKQENRLPNMRKLFVSERRKRVEGSQDNLYPPEDHSFSVRVVGKPAEFYAVLNTSINDLVETGSGNHQQQQQLATIVVANSSSSSQELRSLIPCLNDLPIVRLCACESVRLRHNWQDEMAKHFVSCYLSANIILSHKIEQSRYYQIPLGNLDDEDPISFACDVFYARNLRAGGHLLWWSSSSSSSSESNQEGVGLASIPGSAVADPLVNQPGLYTSSCLQLELVNVPACALMNVQKINELDGVIDQMAVCSTAAETGLTGHPNLGPSASGAFTDTYMMSCSSMRILRQTVGVWIGDAVQYKNEMADTLLAHLLRWLINPEANLHDPCLASAVILALKKTVSLLINEIERLGGVVVYADASKMIVCFKKHGSRDSLVAYANYICRVALQLGGEVEEKLQIFSYAHIRVQKCWHALLWIDTFNFCGLINREPLNLAEKRVEAKLFMVRHLDLEIRKQIVNLIGSYVVFIAEQFAFRELAEYSGSVAIVNATVFPPDMETDRVGSEILRNVRDIINVEMNGNMLTLSKWAEKCSGSNEPRFLHSYFAWNSPSIECIRCLCAILSVDELARDLVFNVEHDLLIHLGYGQPIVAAESNPTTLVTSVGFNTSLVVPQVVCRACLSVANVDLFRDCSFNLIEKNIQDHPKDFWLCGRCKRPYDACTFELFLIDVIDELLVQFISQDYQCPKCREVRLSNFEKYCKCSGMDYQRTFPMARFIEKIKPIYWIGVLAKMNKLIAHVDGLTVICEPVARLVADCFEQQQDSENDD